MKNILFVLGAAGMLGACGYSQDKFGEDAGAALCDVMVTCLGASESDCDSGDDTSTDDTVECDFDSAKAKECVSALEDQAASCPTDDIMVYWVDHYPTVCNDVVTNCTGGEDSGGDSGDTGA